MTYCKDIQTNGLGSPENRSGRLIPQPDFTPNSMVAKPANCYARIAREKCLCAKSERCNEDPLGGAQAGAEDAVDDTPVQKFLEHLPASRLADRCSADRAFAELLHA